ncbi:MAG: DNA gyrase inhibitor YacG [Kofleriaceae bacterium]
MSAICPTCKEPAKKAENKAFPFCCERCRLIDLGRWLDEEYRIPDTAPPVSPAEKTDE